GDVIFFQKKGMVNHVGLYLGCGQFIEMPGDDSHPGKPISVTPLSLGIGTENGHRITYGDVVKGYGNVSKLDPVAPTKMEQARAASGHAKKFEVGPNLPGGVYISPELIYEA